MDHKISKAARGELLEALRNRYRLASRKKKAQILDEVVTHAQCHRKHAIRLLADAEPSLPINSLLHRRIYDEAIREAMTLLWEAADRVCGKRLKAILPQLVDSMQRHGHLKLDPEVQCRLLQASAATIDRLLAPIREKAGTRKRHKASPRMKKQIPIRTFADWHEPNPGYLLLSMLAKAGRQETKKQALKAVI